MTPEREKFLASISKEEKAIREQIQLQKDVIYNYKREFENPHSSNYAFYKQEIFYAKAIIKALKKQIPAPIINENKWTWGLCRRTTAYRCSVCKTLSTIICSYCPNCGQNLR